MKCVDCHYLYDELEPFHRFGYPLSDETRAALRGKNRKVPQHSQVLCYKDLEQFAGQDAATLFRRVLRERECPGYRDYDRHLDLEQMYRQEPSYRYLDAMYDGRCEPTSLKEYLDRFHRGHHDAILELEDYWVRPHLSVSPSQRAELSSLIRESDDEEELHQFLKRNPHILARMTSGHHGQWCLSKPTLGRQIPDFLVAGLDSAGMWWYGVELESPKHRMFTGQGDPTKELNHAIRQINNWRAWLRRNISYAQRRRSEGGLGLTDIDADLPCVIIIGRRENDPENTRQLRQEMMKQDKAGLRIHHYDWLLEP